MHVRPVALAAALLLVPMTGCIGDQGDAFDPIWSERALAFGDGHDHASREQHRGLSTPNFELVAYDPLISEHYGTTAGGYFCGDVQPTAGERRIAAVESRTDVAFALAELADPLSPQWVGEFLMPTTHVYDLAVTPDSRHVVLVTSDVREGSLAPGSVAEPIRWRTPCGDAVALASADDAEPDPVPRPMSIILVDIQDPSTPFIVEQEPLLGSGHSVLSREVDGRTWVLVTTTRVYTPSVPVNVPGEGQVSFFEFYELVEDGAGAHLELLSVFKPPPGEDAGQALGPRGHDAWLDTHPGTGQLLAYLVGHSRFTIVDLADPRQPQEIGRWTEHGPGREGFTGALHSALPMPELWDGHHYTIIGPEFGNHPEGHPSGIVWVIDTTDPTAPFEVGAWTLPHEVEWEGTYMFSNHYYSVRDRTLFVSMYHGGVWAIDLSSVGSEPFVLLDSIGVYLPDQDPPTPEAESFRWAPTVEEAFVLEEGYIVTFDGNSGLYVVTFDETRPAPPPAPWPIDPVHG